jgi:hypothetical protein
MIYLKINTDQTIKYPYSIQELKLENPNTSFPETINNDIILEYNIHQVINVNKGSDHTKNYTEGEPILVNGLYFQNWIITDATQEEIDQHISRKWSEVRSVRDLELKTTDFTMLEDFPQRGTKLIAWKNYRQALRDITLQTDPFNITFPSKPI